MPTLAFDSLDISYEVSGSGPLLILHHGYGDWGRGWNRGGWVEALEPYATVLIFDAVGHGRSTRSHDPDDHEVHRRAAVVTALADELGSGEFGFLGFSMGGRVGFELAASAPQRLSALVIGGMHILPPSREADQLQRRINTLRSGRATRISRPDGDRPGNDPLALAASSEALLRWPGAEGRLGDHRAPTMLFCGEDDKFFENARTTAEEMKFEFTALPGANHYTPFTSSELAVISITEFFRKHLR